MGVEVKGAASIAQEVKGFLSRAVGHEREKLAKAIVKSAIRISPSEYWARGKYATGEYQRSWSTERKGSSTIIGNKAPHALVIEFGSDGGSLRRSGRKRQRKHKVGGEARIIDLAPQKVLARAITMGFDATKSDRRKRKSLDGKGLK